MTSDELHQKRVAVTGPAPKGAAPARAIKVAMVTAFIAGEQAHIRALLDHMQTAGVDSDYAVLRSVAASVSASAERVLLMLDRLDRLDRLKENDQ